VVNVLTLVETPSDFTTVLGQSSFFGPGTHGYGCAEVYDYAMVENVAGPVGPQIYVNVWDPYSMSTPASTAGLKPDNNGEIAINAEVILPSLVVKGASGTTYKIGVDYSFAYNDDSLKSGTITVFANSGLVAESSITVSYSVPNLTNVTSSKIIGGTQSDGSLTGLQLLDQAYDMFNLTIGQVVTPGFSHDPMVGAAGNARVQSLSDGRFKATFIADTDYNAVTQYSQLAQWKSTNNYESRFQNLTWPNIALGSKSYHGSTVLAVTKANQAQAFRNLPVVSPSNKPIAGTGTILTSAKPIMVGLTQAGYIETLGICTFVNDRGWKTLGDYTCSFDSGTVQATDPVDFWINESDFFIWMENTLGIFLAGEIDQPGNLTTLTTIENSIQQWGNGLIQAGACWTFRCSFNPNDNPAENILAGIYTFAITCSPVTPLRTIQLNFSYDVAGMTAAIQSINLVSST
jgi:phage tail sheath protein FI